MARLRDDTPAYSRRWLSADNQKKEIMRGDLLISTFFFRLPPRQLSSIFAQAAVYAEFTIISFCAWSISAAAAARPITDDIIDDWLKKRPCLWPPRHSAPSTFSREASAGCRGSNSTTWSSRQRPVAPIARASAHTAFGRGDGARRDIIFAMMMLMSILVYFGFDARHAASLYHFSAYRECPHAEPISGHFYLLLIFSARALNSMSQYRCKR